MLPGAGTAPPALTLIPSPPQTLPSESEAAYTPHACHGARRTGGQDRLPNCPQPAARRRLPIGVRAPAPAQHAARPPVTSRPARRSPWISTRARPSFPLSPRRQRRQYCAAAQPGSPHREPAPGSPAPWKPRPHGPA